MFRQTDEVLGLASVASVEDEKKIWVIQRSGSNATTVISRRWLRAEDVVFREEWWALRVKGICPCNVVGLPKDG